MAMRADLGRENKPRCMMDLATIGAKELKKQGILKNLDESTRSTPAPSRSSAM